LTDADDAVVTEVEYTAEDYRAVAAATRGEMWRRAGAVAPLGLFVVLMMGTATNVRVFEGMGLAQTGSVAESAVWAAALALPYVLLVALPLGVWWAARRIRRRQAADWLAGMRAGGVVRIVCTPAGLTATSGVEEVAFAWRAFEGCVNRREALVFALGQPLPPVVVPTRGLPEGEAERVAGWARAAPAGPPPAVGSKAWEGVTATTALRWADYQLLVGLLPRTGPARRLIGWLLWAAVVGALALGAWEAVEWLAIRPELTGERAERNWLQVTRPFLMAWAAACVAAWYRALLYLTWATRKRLLGIPTRVTVGPAGVEAASAVAVRRARWGAISATVVDPRMLILVRGPGRTFVVPRRRQPAEVFEQMTEMVRACGGKGTGGFPVGVVRRPGV
jgi:hypothetical protein